MKKRRSVTPIATTITPKNQENPSKPSKAKGVSKVKGHQPGDWYSIKNRIVEIRSRHSPPKKGGDVA